MISCSNLFLVEYLEFRNFISSARYFLRAISPFRYIRQAVLHYIDLDKSNYFIINPTMPFLFSNYFMAIGKCSCEGC